jgi:hypothetical protein
MTRKLCLPTTLLACPMLLWFAGACGSEDDGASPDGQGATAGSTGAGEVEPGDVCAELVAANCSALSAYLTDEAQCQALLPTFSTLCPEPGLLDALLACSGPDPTVTCDAEGMPVFEGCEAEAEAIFACVYATGGGAGAGGAGGSG